MRNNDMFLNVFGDIKILYQYLYMNEEHFIVVENIANMSGAIEQYKEKL